MHELIILASALNLNIRKKITAKNQTSASKSVGDVIYEQCNKINEHE